MPLEEHWKQVNTTKAATGVCWLLAHARHPRVIGGITRVERARHAHDIRHGRVAFRYLTMRNAADHSLLRRQTTRPVRCLRSLF